MIGPHGRVIADEVNRLLTGKLTPLSAKLTARRWLFQLPFEKLPTREELRQRVAAAGKPKATFVEKRLGVQATALLTRSGREGSLSGGQAQIALTIGVGSGEPGIPATRMVMRP